ncbi:hypothetical protein QLX67_06645 [Balneolaceae bacterium ANBcel3]|nr:hypothetical protein [Balneolaceae bacterium ANBcel3]
MKKSFNKRPVAYVLLSLFVLTLLYVPACDITDPTEGIKVILNTKERTSTVSMVFRDAHTNEPVGFNGETTVHVTVNGPDSDKVIDLLNREKTSFQAAKGFLSFALLDEVVPDEQNPLQITVVARADGYITTSVPITINQEKATPVDVIMVNASNPPKGVTGNVNESIGEADNQGNTASDIYFETDSDQTTNSRASFRIRENSRITTADGQPLRGELRSSYHLFNSRDSESLQSFPGGFSVQVEDAPNGSDRVFFTTGGFTSVEISDENGNRARNFDPPIEVSIELDSEVRDHQNQEVQAGNTVPIWSYDDETGTWTFEGDAEVVQGDNGNLEVNFEASHLSWWNIDWFGDACYEGVRVNLIGNNSQLRGRLLRADNGAFLGWAASRQLPGVPNFIQFLWAPRDVPGILELYDMNENLVTTVDLPQLCSEVPVDVTLGTTSEITVTFRGRGVCDGSDVEVRPSFPAYYRPASGGQWVSAGTVSEGEISITLPSQGNYFFGAYYEDDWYDYLLDLTTAEDGQLYEEIIDLPDHICDDL